MNYSLLNTYFEQSTCRTKMLLCENGNFKFWPEFRMIYFKRTRHEALVTWYKHFMVDGNPLPCSC